MDISYAKRRLSLTPPDGHNKRSFYDSPASPVFGHGHDELDVTVIPARIPLEPRTEIFHGVIKQVPVYVDTAAIVAHLANIGAIGAVRLSLRAGGPSRAIRVTFRNTLPHSVTLWQHTHTVSQYVWPVRRCTWCQRTGHTKSKCTDKAPTCSRCGEQHHRRACTSTTLKCINCNGAHSAAWRGCSASKRKPPPAASANTSPKRPGSKRRRKRRRTGQKHQPTKSDQVSSSSQTSVLPDITCTSASQTTPPGRAEAGTQSGPVSDVKLVDRRTSPIKAVVKLKQCQTNRVITTEKSSNTSCRNMQHQGTDPPLWDTADQATQMDSPLWDTADRATQMEPVLTKNKKTYVNIRPTEDKASKTDPIITNSRSDCTPITPCYEELFHSIKLNGLRDRTKTLEAFIAAPPEGELTHEFMATFKQDLIHLMLFYKHMMFQYQEETEQSSGHHQGTFDRFKTYFINKLNRPLSDSKTKTVLQTSITQ